jgi:erythronate-4-phosphate dehydrogenase
MIRIVADSKMGFARESFARLGEVTSLPTPEITRESIRTADAVIVRSETKVGRDFLEGSAVRFVGTATIGTDHVDLPYLEEKGIGFASAPGSNANSVGEYIVAGLLEYARRRRLQLAGMEIGIVGVGNVGSRVARYAAALGMRTLLNDPPLERATGEKVYRPLNELMGADIITLHVPLTKEGPDPTYHLFDASRLEKMKRGSLLINTSRGSVVQTLPLRSALEREGLAGALLDVWEGEPEIDASLLALAELGTAHIAGFSTDGKWNAARMLVEALSAHFRLGEGWSHPTGIPAPPAPLIEVPSEGCSDQEVIRRAVVSAYEIAEDDILLRRMIRLPGEERPRYFRALRANYRQRREFSAYTVRISPPRPEAASTLNVLGFHTA